MLESQRPHEKRPGCLQIGLWRTLTTLRSMSMAASGRTMFYFETFFYEILEQLASTNIRVDVISVALRATNASLGVTSLRLGRTIFYRVI
jgi:hypothetical protein